MRLQEVVLVLLGVCLAACGTTHEEGRHFLTTGHVEMEAFLQTLPELESIGVYDDLSWVEELVERVWGKLTAEVAEQLGSELVKELARYDTMGGEEKKDFEKKVKIAEGRRWTSVQQLYDLMKLKSDKAITSSARVTVVREDATNARLGVQFGDSKTLPRFIVKYALVMPFAPDSLLRELTRSRLYDLSVYHVREEVVMNERLRKELMRLGSRFVTHYPGQPLARYTCSGVDCDLPDGHFGYVEVHLTEGALPFSVVLDRTREGTEPAMFDMAIEAVKSVAWAMAELHRTSAPLSGFAANEPPVLKQFWSVDHVQYVRAIVERQTKDIEWEAFWEEFEALEAAAQKQPEFCLIHGDATTDNFVFPQEFWNYGLSTLAVGWSAGANYLAYEVVDTQISLRYFGAPELDYYSFYEDVKFHMEFSGFFPDEVEEVLGAFEHSYGVHKRFMTDESWKTRGLADADVAPGSGGFADERFTAYCRFLAKLQLVEGAPQNFRHIFPEFMK